MGSLSPRCLGSSQEAPPALPSLAHLGGRLNPPVVSRICQDATCHAAPEPQASVSPTGTWGLNPQIGVISPAKAGQPGDVSHVLLGHTQVPLSRCPSGPTPFLGDLHPHLALIGLLRVKQNKGQMCKVTRSSSTRVHKARLWHSSAALVLPAAGGEERQGPQLSLATPGISTDGAQTSPRPIQTFTLSHCLALWDMCPVHGVLGVRFILHLCLKKKMAPQLGNPGWGACTRPEVA